MTRSAVFAALAAAACFAAGEAAAQQDYTALSPGLWEIRTNTRMQGMPAELPPVPYTTMQCLTQELLNNQENLATVTASRGKCDIHDADVSSERTNWTMSCEQNGMHIEAKGVITPISQRAYTGNVHFIMDTGSVHSLNGVVNVQGLWQGECEGSAGTGAAKHTYRTPVYSPE